MVTIENHQQAKALKDFLTAFNIPFKKSRPLPEQILSGIAMGQKDIESGRTVSLEEFKKGLSISTTHPVIQT